MDNETKSKVAGGVGTGAGVAGSVGTVVAVGGGTSAAAITSGLATVGGIVGGGMLAGVGVLAAAPLAVGGACYGICKAATDENVKNNIRTFCSDVSDWVESWFL